MSFRERIREEGKTEVQKTLNQQVKRGGFGWQNPGAAGTSLVDPVPTPPGLFASLRVRLQHLTRLLIGRFRVNGGDLNVGFHHFRLGWTQFIRKIHPDNPPASVSVRDSVEPDVTHTHYFEERAIWEIRNARVNHRTGAILVNGNLVRDSVRAHSSRRSPKFALLSGGHYQQSETAIIFSAHRPQNYYHWLLEDFPAVLRARKVAPDAEIVFGGRQPSYVRESLELAGEQGFRTAYSSLRNQTLFFAGQGRDSGWPHPEDIGLLRKRLRAPGSNLSEGRKIYLSRPPGRRSFANENLVAQFMRSIGFEVISPETLDVSSQVRLFETATVVVGAHGAALANILFCPPGARILELAPRARALQTYEVLALYSELTYSRVLIDSGSSDDGSGSLVLSPHYLSQIKGWLDKTKR